MLENRRMAMVEDRQTPNFQPLFLIDHDGLKSYIDRHLLPTHRISVGAWNYH